MHDGIYYVHQGFLHPPEGLPNQELYGPGYLQSGKGLGYHEHESSQEHHPAHINTIHIKILELKTAKEMWELLWTEYGISGIAAAFSLFKSILDLCIPSDQHPGKVLDQLQMYFVELKDAKFKLPTKIQIVTIFILYPCILLISFFSYCYN